MAYSRYSIKISPVLKNKTVRTYSSISFSIIAITILTIFAIKPTVENVIALQKQIDTQTQTLKALKDKSAKLAQAINNYNTIPDETKLKLYTLLPNTPNPTCLLDVISNHSASAQVQVTGFQIEQFDLKGQNKCAFDTADLPLIEKNNTPNSTLKEIPFTINVTNGYPQVSSFISSFNSSVRLISIESASFSKNDNSPLILSISGKAYFYK